jgi:hypothetical protein
LELTVKGMAPGRELIGTGKEQAGKGLKLAEKGHGNKQGSGYRSWGNGQRTSN